MKSRWKKIRHRLEWLGCSLLAWLVPRLPRRTCARLADFFGALVFYADRRGRAVALANLEAAFGDEFSPVQKKRIARESYQNFARAMFDLFWSSRLTRENFRDWTRLENFEFALAPEVTARGSITITTHLGSFEWMLIAMGLWGHTGLGVTEGFKNPLLTGIFQRLRQNGGCQMIEQERSMVRMFKAVKRGGNVGMLIDFNLRPDQPSVIIDCFGLKTCVTFIHAMLHQRTGAPLLPVESVPLHDGTSRIVAHPPLMFPPETTEQEIAQACWDFFEKIIRSEPGRWMWAYKHWRYQPRDAARVYPFYANESGKFEKLLQQQRASEGSGG